MRGSAGSSVPVPLIIGGRLSVSKLRKLQKQTSPHYWPHSYSSLISKCTNRFISNFSSLHQIRLILLPPTPTSTRASESTTMHQGHTARMSQQGNLPHDDGTTSTTIGSRIRNGQTWRAARTSAIHKGFAENRHKLANAKPMAKLDVKARALNKSRRCDSNLIRK